MTATRAFDFLYQQPLLDTCLSQRQGKDWLTLSTAAVIAQVEACAVGLLAQGIRDGDRVAIMADNCVEWCVLDHALQIIGAVSVPLYPTISEDDARYILQHAGVKLAFAGSKRLAQRLLQAGDGRLSVYGFDGVEGACSWRTLHHPPSAADRAGLGKRRAAIAADAMFTLIYTSGTTGRAKGVMLSHRNVVSNVQAVARHTAMPHGQCRALSFLPMSHIFERSGVYYYLHTATSVAFASVETLSGAIADIRPHTFSAVPRVLEKVHDKLVGKARELSGLRRLLYHWAVRLAERYDPAAAHSLPQRWQLALADRLVYRHWRSAMGGSLRWVNVGSAALQPRLARLFWAAGIVVSEGYGMSETSPVIAANPFTAAGMRIGSVGVPMDNVELRLAADGEIQVRGPGVMLGYYQEPALTAEVLSADGWLATGDIGTLRDGYLTITDRKKEMFKISNGKYIAPQALENKLKESAFIDQVMVVGDGQKFAAALIVPLYEKLKEWCAEHDIAYTCDREMRLHPRVQELLDREIKRFNRHFGSWEHIKKFTLLDTPWTVDGGELAHTLKLKRKVIAERCAELINGMYAHA